MANNYVNSVADYSFTSTGTSAYTAGDIFTLNHIAGVINNSVVADTDDKWDDYEDTQKRVVVMTEGVYTVDITTGDSASTGDKLYVNASTGIATVDTDDGAGTDYVYLGIAWSDQDGSTDKIDVKLNA